MWVAPAGDCFAPMIFNFLISNSDILRIFEVLVKHLGGFSDLGMLMKQILFASPRCRGFGLPAVFFSEKARSWNFEFHLCDFQIF